MNPKKLSVRMDPTSGDLFLTEERYRKTPRKIANITSHVLLALCADLTAEDGTESVSRDVKFSDGFQARITIASIKEEPTEEPFLVLVT